MKWKGGLTWHRKKAMLESWHPWFAWFPVCIGEHKGYTIRAWFEVVWRRGKYNSSYDGSWSWIYEEKK